MKRRPASRPGAPAPQPSRSASLAAPPPWPVGREWLDPRAPFLVPLLVLLAARAVLWAVLPHATEDAYIAFRYARNLAVGNGLAYNPGERVLGFSSPLWTVWNALGCRLFADPVNWSRFWSVTADLVTLILVAGLLQRHVSRAAAWCFAFFFAIWPYFAAVAVSGMETSLMLALIALAAVLAERHSHLAGPALAALALVRPEGPAAAAVVALGARGRDRLVGFALAGIGVAWLWRWFGTPVPQSVLAKAGIYGHPGPLRARFWWDWLVPFPIGGPPTVTEGVHLYLLCVLMAPAVALGVPVLWRLRRTALGLAAAACLAVWLGYAALGVAFFYWYLVVPLGGFAMVAAAGLPRVVRGRAVFVSAAAFVLGMWGIGLPFYVGRAKYEEQGFAAVADYLLANARRGEAVFLEPIGIVGYRNPLVVVDEVGLVTPGVTRRRAEGPGWYADILSDRSPEWLVVRRGMLSRGLAFAGRWAPFRTAAERESLLARYELARDLAPGGDDQTLVVLRRRP